MAAMQPGGVRSGRLQLLTVLTVLTLALVGLVTGAALFTRTERTTTARPVTLSERPGDLNAVTRATVASLEEFWATQFPATYRRPYTPLTGGYRPETPQSPPFRCSGQRLSYRDIRLNAFYCPADDYIAWDAAMLFPQLDRRFGSVAPAIVLAHETGHAVQRRAGVQAPSLVIELQADCFAGAWVHYAQTSGSDPVQLAGHGLDSAVAAILLLRDQPGTPAVNPQAHGLGFDRVNAFQTGYDGGTAACAAFPAHGVLSTEMPFTTYEEAVTGGNAPYAEAVPLITTSLDRFWAAGLPVLAPSAVFTPPVRRPVAQPPLPACDGVYDQRAVAGYCPADNAVTWADALLYRLHQTGDMVTGAVLSEMWGRAAQTRSHRPIQGVPAGVQRDCFTGAWVASIAGDQAGALFRLSPGDLDEVLVTIVATSIDGPDGVPAGRGGAFERTAALRAGLLGGLPACR
jgi:predicted metalloprotease